MPLLRTTLLLPVLVGALAACSEEAGSSTERSASATATSTTTRTAYVPLDERSFPRAVASAMEGRTTVHVTGDMAGEPLDLWMRVGSGKAREMRGTMGGSEMLLVDGDYYQRQPGDTTWTLLPAELSSTMVSSFEEMSPTAIAREYAGSLTRVSYDGTERSDGTTLHAYDLELDTAYALDAAREEAEELGLEGSSMGTADLPEMEYRLLLDDRHLLRRVEVTTDGQPMVMTYDWGGAVEIAAPEADAVETATP